MKNEIMVDPETLSSLTAQLKKLSDSLQAYARDVNRIQLTRDTGAYVEVSSSAKLKSIGSQLSAHNVRQLLEVSQRALNGMGRCTERLGGAVAEMEKSFSDCERDLIAMVNGDGGRISLAGYVKPLIGTDPADLAKWLFQNAARLIKEWDTGLVQGPGGEIGLTFTDNPGDGNGISGGIYLPGLMSVLFHSGLFGGNSDGSGAEGGDASGWESSYTPTFSLLDIKGKTKPIKWDDIVDRYHTENGKRVTGDDQMDADAFGGRFAILTVGGEWAASKSIFSEGSTTSYGDGKGTLSAQVDVGRVDASASWQMGLYSEKVGPDGQTRRVLSPGAEGKVGLTVTALEGVISTEYELIDGVSLSGKTTSTIGKGSAEAEVKVGIIDGEFAMYAKGSAEAIAVEVKQEVSADVAGVNVKGEAGVNIGIGVHGEVGYHDGVFVVDAGVAAGLGVTFKGEIDVSGLVDTVAEHGEQIVQGAKKVGEAVVDTASNLAEGAGKMAGDFMQGAKNIGRGLSKAIWSFM